MGYPALHPHSSSRAWSAASENIVVILAMTTIPLKLISPKDYNSNKNNINLSKGKGFLLKKIKLSRILSI